MRCPSCASLDTQVKDSRPTEDSAVIRRRRVCLACNFRFTTFERVQLRELTVIKRNGRRVPFDRDKLLRSVQIALRKRPVEPGAHRAGGVEASCASWKAMGESEVSSETIGETGDGAPARGSTTSPTCALPRCTAISARPRTSRPCSTSCRARTRHALDRRRAEMIAAASAGRVTEPPIRRRSRFMALALALGPARPGTDVAEPGGRRRGRAARGRRAGRGRARLDRTRRAAARRDRGARAGRRGRRAARRSTSRSSRARITARRRPAPTRSSRPASPAWSRRWKTPIRRSPGRATHGCARPASRSTSGVGAEEARRAHAGHIRRIRDGRPHVTLKLAVSADGKAGLAGRRPAAITGEAARRRAHMLRAANDAILIGIGTALADDPLLTCRLPGMAGRSPVRVVLDGSLRHPARQPPRHDGAATTPVWIVAAARRRHATGRGLARGGGRRCCGSMKRAAGWTLPRVAASCSPPAASRG